MAARDHDQVTNLSGSAGGAAAAASAAAFGSSPDTFSHGIPSDIFSCLSHIVASRQ
jgi:hypothetical protein